MTGVPTRSVSADEFFNVGFFADPHRNVDDIENLRSIIEQDLKVRGIDPRDEAWRGFLTDVCLAIRYYSRKLKIAMLKRAFFVALSIALIVVIPAVVHLLVATGSTGNATKVMAQITAALTGILALQKAFSTWLSQSQRYGRFWEALADLKDIYYGLRTKLRAGNRNKMPQRRIS